MIASLNGKLIFNDVNSCVIECGGVGYRCIISGKTLGRLPNIGENAFLFTYMAVKEDSVDLFGFCENTELECFKMITSVSGVGPKIGIALLSAFTPEQIALFVAGNDAKSLTAASGVGIKLAQRIILELKDKVSAIPGGNSDDVIVVGNANVNSSSKEAIEALVSLGFSQSEASLAVGRCDPSMSSEQMIKEALKQLSRQV